MASTAPADGDAKPAPAAAAAPDAAAAADTTTGSWADESSQMDGNAQQLGGSDQMVEPEYDVEVKLIDENSPLYSVKSFEDLGLSPEILKGLYAMRFNRPSKIQEKALPLLLGNPPVNMIGQSQSGTGKTAAFTLNLLSRLNLAPEAAKLPQALVMAPSRELARQIIGVIQVMGRFIEGLKVEAAIPVAASERGRTLEGQVVVGTPGTTMDLIKRRQLNISQMKILVLDEADNMLDQQGMGEQCMRVKMALPKNIQIVLFSATFPPAVVSYAEKFAPRANQLTLKQEELTVDGIKQLYMDCPTENDKYEILVKLYGLMTIGSSIIFVKKRDTAVELERRMTAEGHKVASLIGGYEGHQRDAIIDAFRSGAAKVLITTNVLARGIDVQTVSMVVNYDIPDDNRGNPDYQTYLHRIGRTGRFGRIGVSISFVHDRRSWEMLTKIGEYFHAPLMRVETSDWDAVEDVIKKVLKNPAADAGFVPQRADAPADNVMS